MLVQSKTLIDAARRNGVKHIVHLGVFSREHDSYQIVFSWHQLIEAYLRDSGIAWTNLHPNMFMQNFLTGWVVKPGVYSVFTSKPVGFTALEDVAEAAAAMRAARISGIALSIKCFLITTSSNALFDAKRSKKFYRPT
jgi:NAD(P)H dehydrogenase (quinone)